MRKFMALVLAIITASSQTGAIADPPLYGEFEDRLTIELCVITSEVPHLSRHVPGTVNVTGRTVCKGISAGRNIRVTVTLRRLDGGNTPPITKSSSGVASVVVNVSMPCVWRRGDALIEYRIKTVHKVSNGKSGVTENGAKLKC